MTTSQTVTGSSLDATRPGRRGLAWWVAIPVGALAATGINLLILLVANLADAGLVLDPDGNAPHPITAGDVVSSSIGPLVVGTLLATLLSRWWPGVLRVAQVVAGALAVLTVAGPLSSDADGGTALALTLMHLVAGTAAVLTLEAIRRRRAPRPAPADPAPADPAPADPAPAS
jgi:hypothetical protein